MNWTNLENSDIFWPVFVNENVKRNGNFVFLFFIFDFYFFFVCVKNPIQTFQIFIHARIEILYCTENGEKLTNKKKYPLYNTFDDDNDWRMWRKICVGKKTYDSNFTPFDHKNRIEKNQFSFF